MRANRKQETTMINKNELKITTEKEQSLCAMCVQISPVSCVHVINNVVECTQQNDFDRRYSTAFYR